MGVQHWLPVVAAASAALAFSPEQMISAPQRGGALPNPSGDTALVSVSQYAFGTKEQAAWWSLLDLKSGELSTLTEDNDVSEIVWLDDKSVLYLNSSSSDIPGGSELWVSDTSDFANGYKAASLPSSLTGLKAVTADSGDVHFVLNGDSYPNGTAYNEKQAKQSKQYLSSARIYDSIYVRHWDDWLDTTFKALFSGTLKKPSVHGHKQYKSDGSLSNLVYKIKNLKSPVPPQFPTSDYELSPNGKWVAFRSKAPQLPKANFTASYIYLTKHEGSEEPVAINGPNSPGTPKGVEGTSTGPSFSPDSSRIAYGQMSDIRYESDRTVMYVHTIGSDETIPSVAKNWDRSPGTIKWSADGKNLLATAADFARTRLFSVPATAGDDYKPKNFTDGGSVSEYHVLPDSSVLVTSAAFWTNWYTAIATPQKGVTKMIASANKIDPEMKDLGPSDTSEFWFHGDWTEIQAWIIYPEGFDKSKTYPLLFFVHGGPQGAWFDGWSSRWNPKVWADQGYVVVAPNPTGSVGFGQKLTNAIQNDWGGAPYRDLVKCFEHVRDNIPYIDTDHAVAAGASYGGYMLNWIQGNALGREFKALVTHDGAFIMDNMYATEELWFPQHEFMGTIWNARGHYRRFDPSDPRNIVQFSTPHLIIHSNLDYRLPVTEGIAMFNVLQERGVPSRFLNFPDENHWVLNPENSLVWHQQVLGWINKYSGIGESNPEAISLGDTDIPVVDYDPVA